MQKLFFLLLLLQARYIFSQDISQDISADWDIPEKRGFGTNVVHGLIAGGEVLLSNLLLTSFNKLYGYSWSFGTPRTIKRSFTEYWIWEDTDGFQVNNFLHPYQGGYYYNAARANGFGFYESFFFCAFGSTTWEIFAEQNRASINDFFCSTIVSLGMGEMFYRLYAEAISSGIPAPLAFFISPMAGFHSLISKWKPPKTGRNIYELYFHIGPGYAQTHYSLPADERDLFNFKGPYVDFGFSVVYGNPFEQETKVPFRQFEYFMYVGMDFVNYFDSRVISDGYLISFSPVYTDVDTMSTGLSFHFDFVSQGENELNDCTINQYSNALAWTVKYQHLFSQNTALQIKSHAGFTFLGISNYYSHEHEWKQELKNYGCGLNAKIFVNLINSKAGRLETAFLYYILWSYPGTKTSKIEDGTVTWLYADVTYYRFVSKHISLGVRNVFSMEQGKFSNFSDTYKWNNAVKMFIAWNL